MTVIPVINGKVVVFCRVHGESAKTRPCEDSFNYDGAGKEACEEYCSNGKGRNKRVFSGRVSGSPSLVDTPFARANLMYSLSRTSREG